MNGGLLQPHNVPAPDGSDNSGDRAEQVEPEVSPMAELIRNAVLDDIGMVEEDKQREIRSLADDLAKVVSAWEIAALDKDGEMKPYIGECLKFKSHTKIRVRGKSAKLG